jgi:histidyl-tRNA synthetase
MIQLIRGFKDILPGEVELWQTIERTAVALFEDFGFDELRIPIMEKTELFARSIGEDTDIVEKEMYTFADRKGELLTLRPEATASIVRAYIQHKLHAADPAHHFYVIGPMFRRERPQKGRYRQFYQIDAEIFGDGSAWADVRLIHLLCTLMERLSVTDTAVQINSLGCPDCRPAYRRALSEMLEKVADRLCGDCNRRRQRNPLRVLDCKVPGCREALTDAPALVDYLCEACKIHFDTVLESLTALNLAHQVDKRLVRGLDYYTRTTFELQTGALGAQSAVAGGGRYDGLVKALGGPDTPASGFAIGLDRLVEIVAQQQPARRRAPRLFIAALGPEPRRKAFFWRLALAEQGIRCEMEAADKSLKAQMKHADRLNAGHVLIIGDAELGKGAGVLRDMTTKAQVEIPLNNLVAALKATLAAQP